MKAKIMNVHADRLSCRMPKVGIRPVIDGRRGGIRESLEGQTMAMAKAVAGLIYENLRYANGLPVESVIADTCIGGTAEAIKSAEKFALEGVGLTITVSPCWCYGTETMDMDALIPKAVWGLNGTERPGAVYLAAVLAGYNQKGLPAFGIYGHEVQDASDASIPPDVRDRIIRFARSGLAVAHMRGKSYLSVGGVSMGIAGSIIDQAFFESYLGMRVQTIDMSEFIRRIDKEIYDKDEYVRALAWVKKVCKEGRDYNSPRLRRRKAQKEHDWETVIKMAIIMRDLMAGNPNLNSIGYGEEALGHNAIAAGFQGQRQWTDHLPNGDFMEAILNSSFDWNGIRQPYIVATENDALNGASMLISHLISGRAQVFADVRTYWSPDSVKRVTGYKLQDKAEGGIIHLINSGSACLDGTGRQTLHGQPVMKPYWELTPADEDECLRATSWYPARLEYFRGGGYSSGFTTRGGMPVTMSRMNLIKGLGPVMQIAEGYTVNLPLKIHNILTDRTDPTWPTTWFVPMLTDNGPFRDVYSVMNDWGANHAVLSYGHIGHDLITVAAMLRIPVSMHNVASERIFRPDIWSAFGAMEPQGADFRACANFGPLYGRY
ncbi:MAG: L-fucose isomerase [Dehalococcoidia bacterium]